MKTNKTTLLSLIAAFMLFSSGVVNATIITFDLTGNFSGQTKTYTVDGLTVTFSNPSYQGTLGRFQADFDGLLVLFSFDLDSFDVVFDQAVELISYNVGYVRGLDGDESITITAGAFSSLEENFSLGPTSFSTQFTVAANERITFTGDFGLFIDADLVQFSSLTVNTVAAVPVPAAVWLMGSALVGLFGFKRKEKITNKAV